VYDIDKRLVRVYIEVVILEITYKKNLVPRDPWIIIQSDKFTKGLTEELWIRLQRRFAGQSTTKSKRSRQTWTGFG